MAPSDSLRAPESMFRRRSSGGHASRALNGLRGLGFELRQCLATEAAENLAFCVNAYKRREIKARLAEIEASDLSDPVAKKAALKEAARLNKMLDQLDKQVRWTFPQWKVTG